MKKILWLVLICMFLFAQTTEASLWKLLTATYDGTNSDAVRIDASTNSLQTIDYEHHEIHSGSHYYVSGFSTLAEDATIVVGITTPDTTQWTHLTFVVHGTSQTEIIIAEDTAITGGGASVPFNSNRNSGNTSNLTAVIAPTISTPGTTIFSQSAGVAGTTPAKADLGGMSRNSSEIILARDTTYTMEITSRDDDNIVSFHVTWYEHTDKH